MGNTKIQWATKVWNPVTGCSKVSEGCRNCYAERMANRLRGRCGYPENEPFRVTLHPDKLSKPWNWRKPQRIFVNSMSDLFHENVPFEFVVAVLARMLPSAANKWARHTFMILTKRPERMAEFFKWMATYDGLKVEWPLPNVWTGVSAENQEIADLRIPILLSIPAAVRFVSVEPMLGPVNISNYLGIVHEDECGVENKDQSYPREIGIPFHDPWVKGINWVIVGGESGPNARSVHPDWVRGIQSQCEVAKVPFFFKQWGEWVHESQAPDILANYNPEFFFDRVNSKGFARVGKKIAGDLLDGKQYHQFPEVTR